MQLLDFIKMTFGNKQMKGSTRIFASGFLFFFPSWKVFIWTEGSLPRGLKKKKAIIIFLENNNHPLGSIWVLFVFLRFVFTAVSKAVGTQCYNSEDYNSKSLVCWPLISHGYSHEEMKRISKKSPIYSLCAQWTWCSFLIQTPQLPGIPGGHFLPARTGSGDNWVSPEMIFLLQAIGLMSWNPQKRTEERRSRVSVPLPSQTGMDSFHLDAT